MRARVGSVIEIGAGLSQVPETRPAAAAAALDARAVVSGDVTLAVVFASPHHAEGAGDLVDAIRDAVSPKALVGCIGESIVGGAREIEAEPAVSVLLAHLPDPVETYHARFTPEGEFDGIPEGGPAESHIVLADPFTFPADRFLEEVAVTRPGSVVVGGMASGAMRPGTTRLLLDDRVVGEGAVGCRLPPSVEIEAIVSQGCRPVGPPYTVTEARGNLVVSLGGRPPLDRVREVYAAADPHDQELITAGLHLGRVIDEHKEEFTRGDFLIRGVLGADRETGAIAVGDEVGVGETVRFHVRDAESADEDLRALLGDAGSADGALLFTCNGRGSRLFSVPDHDAALVAKELGGVPAAGFFAAGELGPVGPRSFLHGFTASLALLRERA